MVRSILRIVVIFALLVVIFMIAKPLFMLANAATYAEMPASAYRDVMAHGLRMDMAVAAYFTAFPALLSMLAPWLAPRATRILNIVACIWLCFVATAAAVALTVDAMLYPYWGFKLDMTPLFYLLTSPSAAMASATPLQTVRALAVVITLAILIGWLLTAAWLRLAPKAPEGRRAARSAVMLPVIALLALAMRGGLTVGTMNLSAAYFSTDVRLNHAAVNPVFSFLYSAAHQHKVASQFRYFTSDDEALALVEQLTAPLNSAATDSTTAPIRLLTPRPDIYLFILESFSAHIMAELGGEPIAAGLDSIARAGVLFTRVYASGARTDRGLTAILSGYPAAPSVSMMKYVEKTDSLPSLPRTLSGLGYDLSYYYGGDTGFTNMKAFLVSSGFNRIIADVDFPISQRLSKWGVHDHVLAARFLADLAQRQSDGGAAPTFTVLQTSSSHEPFEVPYSSGWPDKRQNAFAYADHTVTAMVDSLARTPLWSNALVVLVADHYGAWPSDLPQGPARHHIPLILTGGALTPESAPRRVDAVASQTDLAATILTLMGVDRSDLTFSRDILAPDYRPMAYFSRPDYAGIVTQADTAVIDVASGSTLCGPDSLAAGVKAYLQTLYNDIDHR